MFICLGVPFPNTAAAVAIAGGVASTQTSGQCPAVGSSAKDKHGSTVLPVDNEPAQM